MNGRTISIHHFQEISPSPLLFSFHLHHRCPQRLCVHTPRHLSLLPKREVIQRRQPITQQIMNRPGLAAGHKKNSCLSASTESGIVLYTARQATCWFVAFEAWRLVGYMRTSGGDEVPDRTAYSATSSCPWLCSWLREARGRHRQQE